jgi:hypothetical protein
MTKTVNPSQEVSSEGDSDNSSRPAAGTSHGGRAVLTALAAAGFVVLAVVLEAVSGAWANSPAPGWAEWLVPLAWPQPLRVAWWLTVAGAAATYHRSLRRAGLSRRPVTVVITVAPFLVFAAGVATGADWATWH